MTHHTQMHYGTEKMEQCIENCLDCYKTCQSTLFSYCMQEGGKHTKPEHMQLMFDCAEMCKTNVDFMLRGSNLHIRLCGVCAEVCSECATECGLCKNDARMQNCAEVCRRCAESCREMAMTPAK